MNENHIQVNYEELRNQIFNYTNSAGELFKKYEKDRNELKRRYPWLTTNYDARFTMYGKTINTLGSLQLAFRYISFCLLDSGWWKIAFVPERSVKDQLIATKEYSMFIKNGYIQGLSSAIESSFRLIVKEVSPDACNKGAAEFKSIYDHLFKNVLRDNHDQAVELFDLFRHIRNTIHNNQHFFSKKEQDSIVIWGGKEFKFEHGKSINFANWELIFEITNEIRKALNRVMCDEALTTLKIHIEDPIKSSDVFSDSTVSLIAG